MSIAGSKISANIAQAFQKVASGEISEFAQANTYISKQGKITSLAFYGTQLIKATNKKISVILTHNKSTSQSSLARINAVLSELGCGVIRVKNGEAIYKASANDALNVEIVK